MDPDRDYYCSLKFRFLKVDLESKTTYNCHASKPHPVNFAWLEKNSGQIFNTDINVSERKQMLLNQRNASCEQNCWRAEDHGARSPRQFQNGIAKTHIEPITTPEIIDITVGSDCNLTCSYCTKEFSSAWRRDIIDHGAYVISGYTENRYALDSKDRVLVKISQPQLNQSRHYQELLQEIKRSIPKLKQLVITGGEPFLNNQLVDLLSDASINRELEVEIYTGLGVNITRLDNMLDKLQHIPKLVLKISAENINEFLEFNRYGIKHSDFVNKIDVIKQKGINFSFHSVISNLTIFGFREFYDYFSNHDITLTFAYQPTMMSPYVLDDDSKLFLEQDLKSLPRKYLTPLMKSINAKPTDTNRINIGEFLDQFVSRRSDLNLNIYPQNFLNWIGIKNVV